MCAQKLQFKVLEENLAIGGMATLKKIALKDGATAVLREMQGSKLLSLPLRRRFQSGTKVRLTLSPHPNIVNSLERGTCFLTPYEIVEFVDGSSLRGLMSQNDPALKENAFAVLLEMAQSLAWVHQCGFMHLDVKPENFLLGRTGRTFTVKLTDFDLTRQKDDNGPRKQLGTPGFMAPEQFLQKLSYQASDVFAFGLIAYQLLTGKHPFTGKTQKETWRHQASPQVLPRPIQEINPAVPSNLEFLVRNCLQKNPAQRPQNMQQVLHALQSCRA